MLTEPQGIRPGAPPGGPAVLSRAVSWQPPELVETALRVLTWNLWWRFGPWEARQPAILETLRRVDADVVCLQEVWEHGGGANQAADLAGALGYHHVYASGHELRVRRGAASATRCSRAGRSRAARRVRCPRPRGSTRCGSRCAPTSTARGARSRRSSPTSTGAWTRATCASSRCGPLCEFVARTRSRRTFPPVLCGDFNAEPDSDEIRMLTGLSAVPVPKLVFVDAWRARGDGAGRTFVPTANEFAALDLEPDRRLDYVFAGFPAPERRRPRRGRPARGHGTGRRDPAVRPLRRLRRAPVLTWTRPGDEPTDEPGHGRGQVARRPTAGRAWWAHPSEGPRCGRPARPRRQGQGPRAGRNRDPRARPAPRPTRCRGDPRRPAGPPGHGHLGQGRDHPPGADRVEPAALPGHELQGAGRRASSPTTTSGGSTRRARPGAVSACSTGPTTRTCWPPGSPASCPTQHCRLRYRHMRRVRADAHRRGDDRREGVPAPVEGRAVRADPGPPRRPAEELEVRGRGSRTRGHWDDYLADVRGGPGRNLDRRTRRGTWCPRTGGGYATSPSRHCSCRPFGRSTRRFPLRTPNSAGCSSRDGG